ncbi:MAG: hypothetical protein JW715_11335 [Sedimentisphaerales bacterium]|nr:hypothetical protein [Sedimentisphaerales bacterium]
MASIKCRNCGLDVNKKAKTCPNCGHTIKKNFSPINVVILLCIFIGIAPLLGLFMAFVDEYRNPQSMPDSTSASRTQALREELSYLSDIPEVAWFEIESNNVYVGFSSLPNDWEKIIKNAAQKGKAAINFGCHVYAISADKKGWRPGDSPFYGEFSSEI